MKVSIIIPVYNVEKYLPRCVQSALSQTYKDIEVILVDDGAEDDSGIMCDKYAICDKRIKVIHKDNGGLSSARNAGIEKANGEAVFFLDSDDYISEDCISKMVKLMEDYSADVSIIQMKYIPETFNEELNQDKEKILEMTSEKAIEESLYQRLYTCCAPAKLYRRKIIDDIRFPLGRISEDLATCHLFLNNAEKVVYSSYYGYYYRQHESSIMHVFKENRLDALEWAKNIEFFCAERYPIIIGAACCRTFNVAVHLILDLPSNCSNHDIYYEMIWNEIKRTRMRVLLDKKARYREKMAAILSFGGEALIKKVWNSKVAIRKD